MTERQVRVSHPHPVGRVAGPRHALDGDPAAALGWSAEERRQQEQLRAQQWEAELHGRRLRGEVASRLELFNLRHAEHAWRLRHSFGIAATAVVLLYADPVAQPFVRVAGKLFPDTDQVADPVRVLYDLCGVAAEVLAAGQDPRTELSENPEPMSARAAYLGVAVSMLDTPAGPWREVRHRASGGALFIPGRLCAVLTDATMLLADRLEHYQADRFLVTASNRLDVSWGGMGRIWRYLPELSTMDDQGTRALWFRLHDLHAILSGAGHAR